jgi:hypothetical protein
MKKESENCSGTLRHRYGGLSNQLAPTSKDVRHLLGLNTDGLRVYLDFRRHNLQLVARRWFIFANTEESKPLSVDVCPIV